MAKVEIDINESLIAQKFENARVKTQPYLDNLVLRDSNRYCPLDTGMLQKSAITNTVLGSGLIIWRTPYARKQYYEHKSGTHKDTNPFASRKWFEVAKAKRLKIWERLVNAEFDKNFK